MKNDLDTLLTALYVTIDDDLGDWWMGRPPASWSARAFLGLSALTEGALADVTVYDADPRREPGTLHHPRRIVLRGRVIR